jgi:hypothetical protein
MTWHGLVDVNMAIGYWLLAIGYWLFHLPRKLLVDDAEFQLVELPIANSQ